MNFNALDHEEHEEHEKGQGKRCILRSVWLMNVRGGSYHVARSAACGGEEIKFFFVDDL